MKFMEIQFKFYQKLTKYVCQYPYFWGIASADPPSPFTMNLILLQLYLVYDKSGFCTANI